MRTTSVALLGCSDPCPNPRINWRVISEARCNQRREVLDQHLNGEGPSTKNCWLRKNLIAHVYISRFESCTDPLFSGFPLRFASDRRWFKEDSRVESGNLASMTRNLSLFILRLFSITGGFLEES